MKSAFNRFQSTAVLAGIFAVLTVCLYLPAIRCDFVSFDDPIYVANNSNVLSGIGVSGFKYALTSLDCTNWHPVTWLSLQLDATLFGAKPFGFHLTNVIWHSINAALLFVVLRQLTDRLVPSAVVAAFFAVHPLHVESVAWVSERKDVLSTFFLLLTVSAYAKYSKSRTWFRYAVVLVSLALGLLAKPMLVTLPILLLLLDFWPLNRFPMANEPDELRGTWRRWRMLIIEKIPMLLLAFGDGVATMIAQRSAAPSMSQLAFIYRLGNAFQSIEWYLRKTVVPSDLTVLYPHPAEEISPVLVGIGIFEICVISIVAVMLRRPKPYLLVGWLWFCISMLPVIGLMQVGNQACADRYTYVPHIGIFLATVWLVANAIASSRFARAIAGIVVILIVGVFAILTRQQIGYWKNNETLWTHAIQVTSDNGIAYFHLADVYQASGNHAKVVELLELGVKTRFTAGNSGARCNFGKSLAAVGRYADAEQQFQIVLNHDPQHEATLVEFGKLLRSQGRNADADIIARRLEEVLVNALNRNDADAPRHMDYGLSLARRGDLQQAVVHLQKAVTLAPHNAKALNNLALVQSHLNQKDLARENFRRAIESDPNLANARFNLAIQLEAENDLAGAIKQFQEVLRINPRDMESQKRLQRLQEKLR